jgi:hypothetical protein
MASRIIESVEVHLSARNLPKLDTFSNSDPFAVVYAVGKDRRKVQVACTVCYKYLSQYSRDMLTSLFQEVIQDCLNPQWATPLYFDYLFEQIQDYVIEVYDKDDGPISDLTRHQKCGEVSFRLSSLMCAPNQKLTNSLRGGYAKGAVTIVGEIVARTRDEFECTFAGIKLANKDGWFGKSDPFLEISKIREDGSFVHVFKNQPVMNNLSPTWPVVRIPLQQLCNGDLDRPIKIDIMDWDSDGTHDPMGGVQTSVRALLESRGQPFNVIEEDQKKKKKGYVNSGTLTALNPCIRQKPGILDFIRGGCEISLSVAIDFTGSNGDPGLPSSLHFVDPTGQHFNPYQQAILSVGQVIEEYDSDKKYPVAGFGAQVLLSTGAWGPVSHYFSLTPPGCDEVHGVNGIFEAYKSVLPYIHLSGPTLFSPLLSNVSQRIVRNGSCSQIKQHYNVLLIITDGIINDMQQTVDAIVACSSLPMSIIIVGVGSADFTGMRS